MISFKRSSELYSFLVMAISLASIGCSGGGKAEVSLGQSGRASVQQISEATNEIQKTVPEATIVWAGGRKMNGGTVPDPADGDAWDFVAVDLNDSELPSWDMVLNQNAWTITPRIAPPLGITYTDLTKVWMDVSAARKLMLQLGITQEIRTWELYQEVNPSYPNPLFMFVLAAGQKVFVDAVTGHVTQGSLINPVLGMGTGTVKKMIILANEQGKRLNPRAIIIRAFGMDISGGSLTSPENTTSWDFTVYALVNGSAKYWQLHYSLGDWSNQEISSVPVDALPVDISALDMSGQGAWNLAAASGKIATALTWEVYRPAAENYPNLVFAFLNEDTAEYVVVDTETEEVTDSQFLP